ncbi:isoprenylcysteine carboxylmethyltransferase family protein [Pseudothauera nasutitermitis]|uniref:Isoprenylcysteine carboxylmethyltransferase family protein n=1 Tax=Pseudothauera nasutitermitis TaxID=2565930 RepID=A0A4S4B3H6_9RHOO|nr:isoprenylcysteine carboxylmethyltransferase family protein [Pseudothauera nasutitermitis]THF67202.1 isoprenylcysteine carboxylmethyltransferase family protein [Pseudothauera nasutitermitis]
MTEDHAEFLLVFLVLSGLVLVGDACVSLWRRYGDPVGVGGGADAELYWLMMITGCSMVVVPLVDAFVPWLEFADFHFSADLAWFGLLVGLLAVWLCWRSLRDRPGSPQSPGQEQFAVSGIYRHIRHPFYTALMLLAMAQVLLSQNWLGGLAAVLSFALVYGLRVPRDELAALERFGHNYLDYMNMTGSLLPRLFSRQRED